MSTIAKPIMIHNEADLKAGIPRNPNILVKLAQKLITLSSPAHIEGSGITRTQDSAPVSDPDGWGKVAALAQKKQTG